MNSQKKKITLKGLAHSVDRMDLKIDDLAVTVSGLASRIDGLALTIDDFAVMVGKGFKELKSDLGGRIDAVESRFDLFEKKVETNFNDLSNRIDGILVNYTPRTEHAALSGRVTSIERKIRRD